ncbi:MAG: hypothetical protein GY940_39160 [bacterium]|nr:hypothetical protein [bacterium]
MKKITILMISLALLTSLAFSANPQEGEVKAKHFDDAKVLRVKHAEGEAFVRRSYDEALEEAATNLPIFEKDAAGTTEGRLEIYLGRLNYLRLDHDTEVEFDKVPELRKTAMIIKVKKGGVYLDIEKLDFERDIQVQTPDCGVFILDKGIYRINVNAGGKTELYVFDGIAEIAGENYNRNVRENQKVVMLNGRVKERPFYFYSTDSDEFDTWNKKRNSDTGYARYGSSRYLDEGYEEYEYELSRNGRWRFDGTYGRYVWIPYSTGDDWRPYYRGRWVWTPFYGYVWMSYDSWGYFTHHYGRWHWSSSLRWHWIPGYRWSPAWVSWFGDSSYYGWCPLSWWNQPVIVYNGRWWRNWRYGRGIPVRARSTTIIRKSQLSSARIHRSALKRSGIAKIGREAFIFNGEEPKKVPNGGRIRVIDAHGRTVIYKEGGIFSKGRYTLVTSTNNGEPGVVRKTATYKYTGGKISKGKIAKYGKSPYTRGAGGKTVGKTKVYKSPNSSKPRGTASTATKPYKYKPYKYRPSSGSKTKSKSSGTKSSGYSPSRYKPRSKSSGGSSSGSGYRSSGTKSKGSKGSTRTGSSSRKPVKKKNDKPSYSPYIYKPSGSSPSSGSESTASTKTKTKTRSGSYYKPSTTKRKRTGSSSSSYRSGKSKSSGSYYKPGKSKSSRSSSSYKPGKSSRSSSSRSSYKPSRGSRSSSSRSSRSSRSRSSRSKSGSSSSSSSKPAKKKN